MLKYNIKRFLIVTWLTLLCFMLLSNVHAWDVPQYLRMQGGARLWFSSIDGDLIQNDRTRLDIKDNLGIKQDELAWEFFASFRIKSIHVARVRIEPSTLYNQSSSNSYHRVFDARLGYDLDFYMSPQILLGLNLDLDIMNLDSRVNNAVVGGFLYNYSASATRVLPSLGLHGAFYPIISGIALRPNISTRFNWWSSENLENRDWELVGSVDIPINQLWTWTVSGGYRIWNVKASRDRDTVDMTRSGFFVETAILF